MRPGGTRLFREVLLVAGVYALYGLGRYLAASQVGAARMLTDRGFVDTGLAFGQSVDGPPGANSLANQHGAMPSLGPAGRRRSHRHHPHPPALAVAGAPGGHQPQ